MFCTFWLANVLRATAACDFSTSAIQKVVRTRQFFHILTCKCASRHSGVQCFRIETAKMAPTVRCFVHFDLQMCFAPQRRAIFPDRNCKNGSAIEVFCAFWLPFLTSFEHLLCNQWTYFHSTSETCPTKNVMKRRLRKNEIRKVGFFELKYLAHCPTSLCPASWKWTQSTFSSIDLLLPKAFTTCQSFCTFPSIWAVARMGHVSIVASLW